jgi:hypothetical protein
MPQMNEQEILERAERAAMSVVGSDVPYEPLLRRRDRKRRSQRITAGVVGIAVFVAAVWVVTSVSSLDRSETPVVPAGSGTTGSAETGSAETGSADSAPMTTTRTRTTSDYLPRAALSRAAQRAANSSPRPR